jgi:GNAT superfamily N-acetyltransferase
MNTKINTLEHTPISEILTAFNSAFANYMLPMQLTEEQLKDKISSDDIDLRFSAGVFEEGQLIAFVLHGYRLVQGKPVIYNAGTGVVPAGRGRRLVAEIYTYLQRVFREASIEKVVLEVLKGNDPAIHTYEKIGFKIARTLNCYKGVLKDLDQKEYANEIVEGEDYNWELFQSFWDWQPSWQNAIASIGNTAGLKLFLSQDAQKNTDAYLIFNPKNNRVVQFAVDPAKRNKKLAKQLFDYISHHFSSSVSAINQDASSVETSSFLKGLGLDTYIDQFEMELKEGV